jgi:hypothetical protein
MKNKGNNFTKLFTEIAKFRKNNAKYLLPDFYNLENQEKYKTIILHHTIDPKC